MEICERPSHVLQCPEYAVDDETVVACFSVGLPEDDIRLGDTSTFETLTTVARTLQLFSLLLWREREERVPTISRRQHNGKFLFTWAIRQWFQARGLRIERVEVTEALRHVSSQDLELGHRTRLGKFETNAVL